MRSSGINSFIPLAIICAGMPRQTLGFLLTAPQSSQLEAVVRWRHTRSPSSGLSSSPKMYASGLWSSRRLRKDKPFQGRQGRRLVIGRFRGEAAVSTSWRPASTGALAATTIEETSSEGVTTGAGKAEGGGAAGNPAKAFAEELSVLDDEQAAMMAEECILVDRWDHPTGSGSKVETHLNSRGLLLHRAFSVFLFDRRGRLLMQRRADSKHTFAGYWTNTCCSHPLWNDIEMGTDLTTPKGDKMSSEGDAAVTGATRAAVRKLGHELGIPAAQLPLENFCFLTKVHYIASSGSTWGEHEIDYVFLIQADVDLDPNPNEVSEAVFLDREGLRNLLASAERGEVEFTPWSAYIIDRFVFDRWWDHVGDREALRSLRDDVIHRVGSCMDSADKEAISDRDDA